MKIAFRRLPFSPEQQARLTQLAAEHNCEAMWMGDAIPDVKELDGVSALIGYFPTDAMEKLSGLKWVQLPCAGAERYCACTYANPDAVLTNCSGAFGISISEWCIAGLLACWRHLPVYAEKQHQHIWKEMMPSHTFFGSRVVVVGVGNLGQSFAVRAKALGAHVIGIRKHADAPIPEGFDEVLSTDRLVDAVREADAVVVCLPFTAQTNGLISREVIAAMPQKAIIVNCGRGRTIDQAAMTEALQTKAITAAVLDVTDPEPLPADHPLWDLDNVILTPHVSGRDTDAISVEIIYGVVEDNMKRWFAGQELTHIVDRNRGY